MGFYEGKRESSQALIAKRGATLTLRRRSGDTFNEATGFTTGGSNVDTTVRGVIYPAKVRKRDGSAAEHKRVFNVILGALDSGGNPITPPEVADQLLIGSKVFEVVDVEPVTPGGIDVIYMLKVAI